MGLTPAYVAEEEAAAFYGMAVNTFRGWQKADPNAPQPRWFSRRCKRYAVADLAGKGSTEATASSTLSDDPIMAAINANSRTQLR